MFVSASLKSLRSQRRIPCREGRAYSSRARALYTQTAWSSSTRQAQCPWRPVAPEWSAAPTARRPAGLRLRNRVAELAAFTRALQWARSYAIAIGRPVCVRYHSEYAARIATGAWRAKKHRDFAAEARGAWAALKRANGGRVWMRHVSVKDFCIGAAIALAQHGKKGTRISAATVN